MSQHVTYTSQTCHKSLDGKLTIFQYVKTNHISSLCKVRMYFALKKIVTCCDVLKPSQFII